MLWTFGASSLAQLHLHKLTGAPTPVVAVSASKPENWNFILFFYQCTAGLGNSLYFLTSFFATHMLGLLIIAAPVPPNHVASQEEKQALSEVCYMVPGRPKIRM